MKHCPKCGDSFERGKLEYANRVYLEPTFKSFEALLVRCPTCGFLLERIPCADAKEEE